MIHAWPDQAIVQALKVGQTVPWVLVGTATTDANGHYTISLPVAKLMPESSFGVVNLEADTSSASYSFPVVVTKNAGNAYLAGPDPVINLTGKVGLADTCTGTWVYHASLGKHWATVGETYVPNTHANQQFTYNRGQSSTIGVGFSGSGKKASFTDDGTYSWSSSLKETWPTFGPRRSVGSQPMSNNTAAVTWTRSLAIHAGLDFHASVETGFDSSAQITYTFLRTGDLCGWKDLPGGAPMQLVVH